MPSSKQKPNPDNLNPAKNVGAKKWSDKMDKQYGGTKNPDQSILENPTYTPDEPSDKALEDFENETAENQASEVDASQEGIQSKESSGADWKTNVSKQNSEEKVSSPIEMTKKKGIIGGALGVIIVVIGLWVTLGPATALVHLKEVLLDKFDRRGNSLMDKRNSRIMTRKMTSDPTQGCTIKIKCRFKGMSEKEIKKFERRNPGSKIETDGCKSIGSVSRCKIKSITYIDEEGKSKKILAKDFKKAFRESPNLRNNVRKYNKSKVAHWIDVKASAMLTKLKVYIGRTKGIDSDQRIDDPKTRDAELKERTKSSVSGEGFDLSVRADTNPDNTENAVAKQLGEDMTEAIEHEVESAKNDEAAGKPHIPKLGNIYTAALQGVCMVRSLVSYAATAVKLKNSAVLIRYAAMFFRIADQTKAGDSKNTSATRAMALLAGILQKPNPNNNNKTAFDSAGYQYAAYGYLPSSNSEYKKYILGGGTAGAAGAIAKNKFAASGCKAVNFVSDLVLAIPIVGDAIGAVGSVAAKPFLPLIEFAATGLIAAMSNTLITGDEFGDEAGNAIVAGVGALSTMNNQFHGFFPLSVAKAVAYDNDARITQSKIAADSGFGYQLDASNTNSFAGRFATAISPTISGINFGNILPKLTTFASTAASSVSVSTYAASSDYIKGEYEQCPDDDYEKLNVAADINCNVQRGLDPAKVGDADSPTSDPYEPDAVTTYMCGTDVDNEDPCFRYVDDSGSPITDSEYDKWIKQCAETDQPLSSDDENWPEGLDKKACLDPDETSDPVKFNMFRMSYFDQTFDDQYEDKDGRQSSGNTAETSTVDGDAKQLAQQLLDNPNVTYPYVDTKGVSAKDVLEHIVTTGKGIVNSPDVSITSVAVSTNLLKALVEYAKDHPIGINPITNADHSTGSNHYKGIAVDLDCNPPLNKAAFDAIADKYGGKNNGEVCPGDAHWHYDFPE